MIHRFLLLCCISFLLSACAETNRNSIAFGLNAAPVTLDPRFATDAISYRITRLIYKSLIDFDEQYRVIPDLADWQQLSLKHYRFRLKDEHRAFHDGTRLTASDVKATYESVLNISNASPHRGSVEMIESIHIVDDDVVDFKLSRDDPLFPGRLVIGIMPAGLISKSHSFNKHPIGSGPIKFVDWQDESILKLYRLNDKQSIDFIALKDPTVRVLKLLRGEIDLIQSNIPSEMVVWLNDRESIEVRRKKGNTFTYLGFNLEDADTGNRLIREAIAYAIDRDAIIEHVLGNSARKAGAIFPPDHWVGHPDLSGFEYNPDKALALLKQAGYGKESPLKLVFKTSNNPFTLRLATIIQHQLKSIGIELDIRSYDWGTFYADIKAGRFQMYSLSWVGLKMPDIFRYVFHSGSVPPNGANRGRLKDANVDATIKVAEQEVSLEKQAELYQGLQEYLLETLPYVPLWYEDNVLAIRKELKGYTLTADGNFDALIKVKRIK